MRQVEEFVRTGDPWIDIGLVSLWETLAAKHRVKLSRGRGPEEIRSGSLSAVLSAESLVLKGSPKDINRLLGAALHSLTDAVWRETKSGNRWWSGAARFFFKQQNNPKKLLTPLHRLKRKGRNGRCDFCGRSGVKVTEARTSENPFIVKSDRMSSFYSHLKGTFNICSFCAFASWFATPSIFFNVDLRNNTLNAFFFDAPDLLRLARFQHALSRVRVTGETFRNFKGAVAYAKYPMENFTSFLLAIHQEMAMKSELLQGITVHVFSARLDARKVSFIRHCTIPNLPKILNVLTMMQWQSKTRQHNALQDVMRRFYFVHGGERNTIIREDLARRFIACSEVADVVEEFLFRQSLSDLGLSKFEVISFYQLTEKYYRRVLGLDSDVLEASKRLGDVLGTVAAKSDNKSILYSLRGLRSLEDYYAYIHQFVTRYMDSVGKLRYTVDTITSQINETNWRNHRSLVGIYGVLTYIDVLQKGKKTVGAT